jgi:hypothetical protein
VSEPIIVVQPTVIQVRPLPGPQVVEMDPPPLQVVLAGPAPVQVRPAQPSMFVVAGLPGLPGPAGPPGAPGAGGDKTFVWEQIVTAVVWTIDHNLNKYPSVTVEDSGGTWHLVAPEYPTLNRVVVRLSWPATGTAYLN